MKRVLALALLSLTVLSGCKKGGNEPEVPQGPVAVTGVTITPGAVTLTPHSEQEFTVEVLPANATNKNYTWSYDVDIMEPVEGKENTFRVMWYEANPTTLKVTTEDGKFTAEAVVTIAESVNPTGISLSDPLPMKVGDVQTLSYTITPTDACQCSDEIIWSYEPYVSIDDPTCVITMDEITGEIWAVRPGTATISVETINGAYTDQKTITVSESDLKADNIGNWAGGTIQLTPSSEVESYEFVVDNDCSIYKGKLECSETNLLTLPLFKNEGAEYPTNGTILITANLKNGNKESCVVFSKAWMPQFYTNSSLTEVVTTTTAGKDIYLVVYDKWLDPLTYGEFMLFANVQYAEGSGVANSIVHPQSYNPYRQIQIRTGEFENYDVTIANGDVKFEFDLTPGE